MEAVDTSSRHPSLPPIITKGLMQLDTLTASAVYDNHNHAEFAKEKSQLPKFFGFDLSAR